MKLYDIKMKEEDFQNILNKDFIITKNCNFQKGDLIRASLIKTITTSKRAEDNLFKSEFIKKEISVDNDIMLYIDDVITSQEEIGLKDEYCLLRFRQAKLNIS